MTTAPALHDRSRVAEFDARHGRRIEWIVPLGPAPQLLLYTACDTAYLDFAISLLRSADVFSPGFRFVVHVVNPAPGDVERVKRVAAALKATRVSLVTESLDLGDFSAVQRRTYYACARFLHLAEFLPSAGTPLLCLDADSLIVAPIDLDFTNKPTAEFCIVRRDQQQAPVPSHLAVLCASMWMRPTDGVRDLLNSVAEDIAQAFIDRSADWYLDQDIVGRHVARLDRALPIFNLKGKYADWNFTDGSVVWTAKGPRKHTQMQFWLLQRMLLDSPTKQAQAMQTAAEMLPPDIAGTEELRRRFEMAGTLVPPRVVIFLPRLDLPWKAPAKSPYMPPVIAEDALDLRMHWKMFVTRLANALERTGIDVELAEVPAWHIDRERVDAPGARLAFVPHRCHLDFEAGTTPVMFYMQEFFRWVFVVDSQGWSAASSAYPVTVPDDAPTGAFDEYRRRLADGTLRSKFDQVERAERRTLVDGGQIPDGPYIFFPLQIPHDQSIRYFSDRPEREVLEALLAWCRARGVALVVKPHPANPKSMAEFEILCRGESVYWSTAHVWDLVAHSSAVYTVNSGVGFEALLHLKPVVVFGRVEYDCVAIRAEACTLDAAWARVCDVDPMDQERRYRAFVDWFLGTHAIDLSTPVAAQARLERLAAEVASQVRAQRREDWKRIASRERGRLAV
jgi:hypothetical protein